MPPPVPLFARTPRLDDVDAPTMRARLLDAFHQTFDRFETLHEQLRSDEAFFRRSIPLRHPLIFYFGHTATLFINKLLLAGLITERVNPRFESMFAIGVDEMSWDDLSDEHYDWPTIDEVKAYRQRVRALVDGVIRNAPLKMPIDWDHPFWAIVMGIEHERIHFETSSVLIRQHRIDYVRPHPAFPICELHGPAPENSLVSIPAGEVSIGKSRTDPYYGWDNEYGTHRAEVPAFQASRYLVSNGELLEFVEDGGYDDDSLWLDEGRAWKKYAQARHPAFWVETRSAPPSRGGDRERVGSEARDRDRHGKSFRLRLMNAIVDMRWDWPAETNFHEAAAFCAWKARRTGAKVRLPSEDEWYRMLDIAGVAEVQNDRPAPANIHLDHWASPCPVSTFAHGPLFDVVGNVWQWTRTPISPFEGFCVHPIYDDFTTPTFDGRHNLMKGGSFISCGNEARHAARYAFRRHFFQHAGFRYVVGEAIAPEPVSFYETDRQLSEYAEFHYGDEYFGVPNFPRTLASLAIEAMGDRPAKTALDLGCATGRATFELARHFDHVTGVDFSARFIGVGAHLVAQGSLRYSIVDEGDLTSQRERRLSDTTFDRLDDTRKKVEFLQGDACNLKAHLKGYDLILVANLIDRLYSPRKLLDTIHERVNRGGLLVVTSPYTWLPEHTPREEWIGGFQKDGRAVTTLDGLKEILGPHFRLVGAPRSVPFVIRETRNKFQHSLSEVTIWERL